jgi:hypothetical protein
LRTTSQVAAAIMYLASDEAAMITGTTLVIDGGTLALTAARWSCCPVEARRAACARVQCARSPSSDHPFWVTETLKPGNMPVAGTGTVVDPWPRRALSWKTV